MRTERLAADAASIARAAEILRRGGLVAFPTETVYGLGARADDARAARGIFEAKGRPPGNPLIVHVPDVASARALAASWPADAERLAQAMWPGPLTLIVARRPDRVADEVAAGGPTVAIRVPVHPVARALLDAVGLPIAAPSANRSTAISPTTAEHVDKSLGGRIDAIVDGGPTAFGIESTIVDMTSAPARLLRPGHVSAEAIAALVPLRTRAGLVTAPDARAPSPGTHARHYAPRARVALVPVDAVRGEVERAAQAGARAGAIERGARTVAGPHAELLPADPGGYAAALYAALHRLEDAGCDVIVIAAVPDAPAWDAVRDRLARASAAP
ncbi:L-threonylcarbamoyladenylate synthase [Sorangium sp. So ce1036]|uniref:L-threonylcarbamoyladenylate synthase n=1 Tax=Sorangium sp. So ce1036 TaxID=3133328 RepID=UPI003F091CFC